MILYKRLVKFSSPNNIWEELGRSNLILIWVCFSKTSWLPQGLACWNQLTLALVNWLYPSISNSGSLKSSQSESIYSMEISKIYKPPSPPPRPFFFLLVSLLLNVYSYISVILNHRYLVIWQNKWHRVFPDQVSLPRNMVLCHGIRITENWPEGL